MNEEYKCLPFLLYLAEVVFLVSIVALVASYQYKFIFIILGYVAPGVV